MRPTSVYGLFGSMRASYVQSVPANLTKCDLELREKKQEGVTTHPLHWAAAACPAQSPV